MGFGKGLLMRSPARQSGHINLSVQCIGKEVSLLVDSLAEGEKWGNGRGEVGVEGGGG